MLPKLAERMANRLHCLLKSMLSALIPKTLQQNKPVNCGNVSRLCLWYVGKTLQKSSNMFLTAQNICTAHCGELLVASCRVSYAMVISCWIELLKKTKSESRHEKNKKITSAPSENSDQPGHPPSLIRVFAVH